MNIILTQFIDKDPGFIVGPISQVLGFIINLVFKFIHMLTENNSLGLSIILFTLVIRFLLLPLNYKQQKSMYMMQKIQPEMKKIQDKYKGNKDPELAKKMQGEMAKLYAKHNYNPLSGCLPLFVQLPILITLFFVMKNPYIFVTEINDIYTQIATQIYAQDQQAYIDAIVPIAQNLVPNGMKIDITVMDDLLKVINKFVPENWETITSSMPSLDIGELLERKNRIEYFLGLNLIEVVGWELSPRLILALLSGATTFLSSWVMSRKNKSADPAMAIQMKIMNVVMPIMSTIFTISVPCGVGLYWIAGNLIQIVQHIGLSKYCEKKFADVKVVN